MKTIQFILFLVFISGSSILIINSGRISPQIEQQHNSYWTIIANAQVKPVSKFDLHESEQFIPPVGILSTRSIGYYQGTGRGSNINKNITTNRKLSHTKYLNPLHNHIIHGTLQPMDLIISPEEAMNYAVTLDAKNNMVPKDKKTEPMSSLTANLLSSN